ncbi:urokinase plasminogen activator surface receptor-like isoform X4 [Betta splendens]|uniref:Urokinase plasminogen activator surface receptor-like isoform X4 n=1 Tax=Betta splendens TaxID=158456 RepID=A0A9W2XRL2_BETSP|nr:urokinase plasminogen activator surface receptor-like isoform X4 [Betta splendens]
MKLILGLSLVWTLLSAAAALKCHCTNAQCSVTTGQNCTTEKHCVTAAFEGTTQQSIQSCAPDAICPSNGLFTFSLSTTTASASSAFNCCSTDNCNSGNVSFSAAQAANGLQCFSCDFNDTNCSKTIQCKGAENTCFRANATVPVLGCASSNLCTAASNLSSIAPIPGLSCCQGSLCNSAPATATTAHLLLVLLLFSLYH